MFRDCVPREEPPDVIVDWFDGGLLISPLLPNKERDQMVAVSRFPKCENAPQPRVHFMLCRNGLITISWSRQIFGISSG